MRTKRRSVPLTEQKSSSKKRKKNTTDRARTKRSRMPNGRSLLLELPAELRNHVYEEVAKDSGAILHPRGGGNLVSRSNLSRVSRQVRREYQSVLTLCATPIEAVVRDFDFTHVVRFLNRLSARELDTISGVTARSQRVIVIGLRLSENCPRNPEKLHSWLLRREDLAKNGSEIDFVYKGVRPPGNAHGFAVDCVCSYRILLETTRKWLYVRPLPEGAVRNEVMKIGGALYTYLYN